MNREAPSPPPAPDPPPERKEGSEGILVVDDEVFIRNALKLYLETLGFRVQTAENGAVALDTFSRAPSEVDLVILDLVMPGIPGIEVLKDLKKRDPTVEVIIVTGCGSMGSAVEALRLGAFDYISKPIVNFDDGLLRVVREAMEARKKRLRRSSDPSATPAAEGKDRSSFLETLIDLATLGNILLRNEPVIEKIRSILQKDLGIAAGLVLRKDAGGRFTPVQTWGFSGPPILRNDHLPESSTFASVRDGKLILLEAASIDAARLGLPEAEIARFRKTACLPIICQGTLWGIFLAFFPADLPRSLLASDKRHPFQVLVPILSTIFAAGQTPEA